MSILNNLLSFLFDLLAGSILMFGLIAVFCILLSSIRVTPDETKCLKIFQKVQALTAILLKVELSDNMWHANAEVQIRDDALEDINFDDQTFILTCEQLNDSCILLKYTKQNELAVQNLQLNNTVWMPLETCSCASRTADVVGSTDSSEKRKMGKAKAYPSQKE